MAAVRNPLWKPAILLSSLVMSVPGLAATGIQVGASGKTFASSGIDCAMHPAYGMSPHVYAGLYNPAKYARAKVSLNDIAVARVNFISPDADIWLSNGSNTVVVTMNKRGGDSYVFDAATTYVGQPNVCIPFTGENTLVNDKEYAASNKSFATVTPGCALNPLTGMAQPYVTLFVNGIYLLNVSANNTALTQLNGLRKTHVPVFLSPGWNVISAANGAMSTDYYVRDGGDGTCALP